MEEQSYFAWSDALFAVAKNFSKPEALKGVRVLELCTRVFGPVTADLLADFGAEVIKIELPGVGDLMRYVAPRGFYWQNISPAFTHMNHNKYHVAIDIRTPEGGELLRALVAKSDVLIENFRAGSMDRWGVGYRELSAVNPALIYQANSGFGQWSKYKDRPSYDATSQAMSGFSAITGFPGRTPLKTGIWIGDCTGALFAAIGILTALHHRKKTGQGQLLDVSQAEGLIRILDWTWLYQTKTKQERALCGNRDISCSPSGVFRCQDGFIAIAALDDQQFSGLCQAMNRPELAADPRFNTVSARLVAENNVALYRTVATWAAAINAQRSKNWRIPTGSRLTGWSTPGTTTMMNTCATGARFASLKIPCTGRWWNMARARNSRKARDACAGWPNRWAFTTPMFSEPCSTCRMTRCSN